MSPLLFLGISAAGGVGASLRFIVDGLIRARFDRPTPWGTISINITGSFLLGFVTGIAGISILPEPWLPIIGTGLLGGYTTFSTASVDTVKLIQKHEHSSAIISGLGTLIGSVIAAGIGLWSGSSF